MNWLPFPDGRLQLCGLPWFAEDGQLTRLPQRVRERVPEPVWGLAQHTSGMRLRFVTDSTTLGLRARFGALGYMHNMPRTGQVGIDLYVDGQYWRPLYPEAMDGNFYGSAVRSASISVSTRPSNSWHSALTTKRRSARRRPSR